MRLFSIVGTLCVALTTLTTTSNFNQAQSETTSNFCQYAGKAYGAETALVWGDTRYTCNSNGAWEKDAQPPGAQAGAPCFYDGTEYSLGAKIRVADNVIIECQITGKWADS